MASLTSAFDAADPASPGHYGASQTALLLLDFHGLFVQKMGGPESAAALAVAKNLRTWAHAQGIQVVHALIDIQQEPFPMCKDAGRFKGIVAAMGSDGGAEATELLEGGNGTDVTFTRRPGYVSALKSPGLEDYLRKKGIASLILTGLSTSGCVMRTSVTACDAEFVVSVISDGCADPVEGVHDMMVSKILNNRGYVFTAAEFQKGFATAQSGK